MTDIQVFHLDVSQTSLQNTFDEFYKSLPYYAEDGTDDDRARIPDICLFGLRL
jgi:hypothetical protein